MHFDKTSLLTLIQSLHMLRDKRAMIPYPFVTVARCLASYLCVTNYAKVAICQNRAKTVFGKISVADHVLECLIPCSSGVLR